MTDKIPVSEEPHLIWVNVSHWDNERQVLVYKDRVLFQVTIECSHCHKCLRRVAYVRSVLTRGGVAYTHRHLSITGKREGKIDWVEFPRTPDLTPIEIVEDALQLGVKSLF
ncbi:hypothetical protein COB55_06085 [Candidatus Wolfebacteria bacterium]|nr:MAG: hypothetical protein COB55_06085 [Candidatus Wolfebacteria bacterium]